MKAAFARSLRVGMPALIVFAAVFLYRFNSLGGSLGGFDDDHFINLLRANHLLAGEWPLRDYADASLQGAWPPLTYLASAGAQLVLGRSLLAEGVLTTAAVALGAAATARAMRSLGVGSLVAIAAAIFSVMPSVKLYGYARPLLFGTGAVVLFRYLDAPTRRSQFALAAVSAVAFLVRHDYLVYLGVGTAIAIVLRDRVRPADAARRLLTYGGLTIALLVPTIIIVHQLVGIEMYVSSARALAMDERMRTNLGWPRFDSSDLMAEANVLAWLYYLFLGLPVAAALVALVRASRQTGGTEVAKILGVAAMAAIANHFLLRGNLEGRLADPATLHALLGGWLAAVVWRGPFGRQWLGIGRIAIAALVTLIAAVSIVAAAVVGSVASELRTTGFAESPLTIARTTIRVVGRLQALPPDHWEPLPTDGPMLAAAYLSRCTTPDDRLINTTYGADFMAFSRRLFAAGQVNFVRGLYASDAEQRRAVARARAQSAPLAFMEPPQLSASFAQDFPIVGEFLQKEYEDAGIILKGGEPYVRVLKRRDRLPVGTFADTGLPCFQ
jgi:hypothetical protein